jgi:hypothetical protein
VDQPWVISGKRQICFRRRNPDQIPTFGFVQKMPDAKNNRTSTRPGTKLRAPHHQGGWPKKKDSEHVNWE